MEISDKEIAAEIAARPERGFSLLFGKYGEPVYWHIRRLVVSHADAQDAAQETFVRVFRFFGNFHGLSLRSWIYRIATNEAMRVLAARKDGQCSMEDSGASAFFADEYVDYGNAGV